MSLSWSLVEFSFLLGTLLDIKDAIYIALASALVCPCVLFLWAMVRVILFFKFKSRGSFFKQNIFLYIVLKFEILIYRNLKATRIGYSCWNFFLDACSMHDWNKISIEVGKIPPPPRYRNNPKQFNSRFKRNWTMKGDFYSEAIDQGDVKITHALYES